MRQKESKERRKNVIKISLDNEIKWIWLVNMNNFTEKKF